MPIGRFYRLSVCDHVYINGLDCIDVFMKGNKTKYVFGTIASAITVHLWYNFRNKYPACQVLQSISMDMW